MMNSKLILSTIICILLFFPLKIAMYFLVGILFDSSIADYLSTPILFILLGLSDILVAILVAYLFCVVNKEKLSSIISFEGNWGKCFLSGGLIGFISVLLGIFIIYITNNINIEGYPIRWLYIGTSFVMVAFAAISEEIVFRGLMQNKLMKVTKPYISIIVTSVIFTLLHVIGNNISFLFMVNVFTASILLGVVYLHSENIFFPIGLHIFWNFAQDITDMSGSNTPSLFLSNTSVENIINGGQGGFEYSITCTVILLSLTAYFSYKCLHKTIEKLINNTK